MRLRIYILSFNDETFNFANERYSNYDWAKVIKIETTVLFESIMYDKWLIDNEDDWKDFDYIGFLSWKFEYKIIMPDFNKIIEILEKNNSYELVPLFICNTKPIYDHEHMYIILKSLFKELNYPDDYLTSNNFLAIYCNFWIARIDILRKYLIFFKKCKNIINNNHIIQKYIYLDAKYGNCSLPKEKLLQIFNKPYYYYHPFIYERIPTYYFHNKKMLIL
jgi:hypothetical protein